IDRERRQARRIVVDDLKPETLTPILRQNIAREARVITDEAGHYPRVGREFAEHSFVSHRTEEYVRGEVYTNTAEGYFSVFKRGPKDVYQHCGERHLQRYLAE